MRWNAASAQRGTVALRETSQHQRQVDFVRHRHSAPEAAALQHRSVGLAEGACETVGEGLRPSPSLTAVDHPPGEVVAAARLCGTVIGGVVALRDVRPVALAR